MSRPDMKLPIGYAMLGKYKDEVAPINLVQLAKLEFREIDIVRYPLWALKKKLLSEPDMGVVFNAANEVAVDRFLNSQIKYHEIALVVFRSVEAFNGFVAGSIDDLYKIDEKVREYAKTISKT
jgi:1-deoxy-D-xylulose-5-phosphate reductoisomerase